MAQTNFHPSHNQSLNQILRSFKQVGIDYINPLYPFRSSQTHSIKKIPLFRIPISEKQCIYLNFTSKPKWVFTNSNIPSPEWVNFPLFRVPKSKKPYFYVNFTSKPKWVYTGSNLPPPEWVQPFIDLSDLVTDRKDLKPSPWVSQILNLLDNSPLMEQNLDVYCCKFLIKLSPSFVAYVLKSDYLTDARMQEESFDMEIGKWELKPSSRCS
uniref:Pentatricopeptide repeat-containing protein n=1 Tax=Solanum tuberosum TaxID=4113 RepID=M1BYK9_SOLTU